ncbi:MAG: hypothetical protein ACR2LI_15245 [Propionibacteriaceae bacterium]
MRTTITLTSEAESLLRRAMADRGVTFKDAVNAAIVAGLRVDTGRASFSTPSFDLGRARVPLDRAVALAADLEDDELIRKQSVGK